MRTSIIVATSEDGYIGLDAEHHSFTWTSEEDRKRFIALSREIGTVIVGSRTYATFGKPLKGRLNVVYSRSKSFGGENVMTVRDDPATLLGCLETEAKIDKVAVIGGAEIYRMFLDAGLVDEIRLTVEPIRLGQGIPFYEGNLADKFDLVREERVGTGTLFRDYVRKQ